MSGAFPDNVIIQSGPFKIKVCIEHDADCEDGTWRPLWTPVGYTVIEGPDEEEVRDLVQEQLDIAFTQEAKQR